MIKLQVLFIDYDYIHSIFKLDFVAQLSHSEKNKVFDMIISQGRVL